MSSIRRGRRVGGPGSPSHPVLILVQEGRVRDVFARDERRQALLAARSWATLFRRAVAVCEVDLGLASSVARAAPAVCRRVDARGVVSVPAAVARESAIRTSPRAAGTRPVRSSAQRRAQTTAPGGAGRHVPRSAYGWSQP